MPRFVLLRHDCPPTLGKPSHWDLMIEQDGALLTWSLEQLPDAWREVVGGVSDADFVGKWNASSASATPPTTCVPATRLPNHRLDYLEYEGPLSGDRGEVHRIDAGAYELLDDSPAALRIDLEGARCRGEVQLTRLHANAWQLETAPPPSRTPE